MQRRSLRGINLDTTLVTLARAARHTVTNDILAPGIQPSSDNSPALEPES